MNSWTMKTLVFDSSFANNPTSIDTDVNSIMSSMAADGIEVEIVTVLHPVFYPGGTFVVLKYRLTHEYRPSEGGVEL